VSENDEYRCHRENYGWKQLDHSLCVYQPAFEKVNLTMVNLTMVNLTMDTMD